MSAVLLQNKPKNPLQSHFHFYQNTNLDQITGKEKTLAILKHYLSQIYRWKWRFGQNTDLQGPLQLRRSAREYSYCQCQWDL